MATEVIIDIIDGRGRLSFEKGWELERIAMVKGLIGGSATRMLAAQVAVSKMLATEAGKIDTGTVLGRAHPARSTCLLYDFSPEIVDSDTVRVLLSYSDSYLRGFNTAEIGASVTQEETNQDAGGLGIYAAYPGKVNQGKFVSKFMPEKTKSITRFEYENPEWKADLCVGTVNLGPWSLDLSALPRTWLCTGITGHSPDHGTTWWVTYTFLFKPANFDVKVVWVDEDGYPPPDAVPYAWQIYTMKNFNILGDLS